MDNTKPKTALVAFIMPNFQKPAHLYPISLSKFNYVKFLTTFKKLRKRLNLCPRSKLEKKKQIQKQSPRGVL